MTPEALAEIIRGHDPVGSAAPVAAAAGAPVTWTRSGAPEGWLVDGPAEGSIAAHRAAHLAGTPSEATVAYGTAVPVEQTAERLAALAELHAETGLLRAVCPVPADGSPTSWGVQDLAVIAAARRALPDVEWIRPSWERLGAGLCQIALAFGANDWVIPAEDTSDPAHLAAAVGRTAVER